MMLIGSSIKVAPIVEWDEQPIGDGKPGPVAKALLELLEEDMRTDEPGQVGRSRHPIKGCPTDP